MFKRLASKPVITAATGVLLFTAGLTVGRIKYTVPGGYHWDAVQTGNMCRNIAAVVGHSPASPMCVHAHELLALAGFLIIAGLYGIVVGVGLGVSRWLKRRAIVRPEIGAQS
jgi:hypothetical protein